MSVKDRERGEPPIRAKLRVGACIFSGDRSYWRTLIAPEAREKGQQPQNLKAVAGDRSGHLVRKYRLTYHRQ
ncbi:hypothetical protein [Microcoleus sp. herbarium14]|uniref:hypothetical protein n=1 Tax=Microcoleus sp. herbarium14 TaxID=3055439 RepID=UPI002FD6C63C